MRRQMVLAAVAIVLSFTGRSAWGDVQSDIINNVVNDAGVTPLDTSYSTNWSGYAALAGSGQAFTSVLGSWTVPSVTSTSGNAYSSCWIGLDGDGSSTVEQIGTGADVINGTPGYYAWYEFYPASEIEITGMAIHPGDQMSAEVEYDGLQTSGNHNGQYAYFLALLDSSTKVEASGELYISTNAAPRPNGLPKGQPSTPSNQSSPISGRYHSPVRTRHSTAGPNADQWAIQYLHRHGIRRQDYYGEHFIAQWDRRRLHHHGSPRTLHPRPPRHRRP